MIRNITLTDKTTGNPFKIAPSEIIKISKQRKSPCAMIELSDGFAINVRESVGQVKAKLKPFKPKETQTELKL